MTFKLNPKVQLKKAKAKNAEKICNVPDCETHRWSLSRYCRKHGARKQEHGHPVKGRRIFPTEYEYEQTLAEEYCLRYSDHDAIKAAIQFIEQWMSGAVKGVDVVGQSYLVRLHENCVQPKSVLYRLMGLWSWAWNHPTEVDDTDQLTFALGGAITTYVTQPQQYVDGEPVRTKYASGPVKRDIGKYIRTNLGAFLLNYTYSIEKVLTARQRQTQLLSEQLPTAQVATTEPY